MDKPTGIPTQPGVYRFRSGDGRVIYVGKAKNLRNRVSSYFSGPQHPRTASMLEAAQAVDWVTVTTESEALQLEYEWIKAHNPAFNVKYRDDKSYPYLAISVAEQFPRLFVYRGDKRKGVRYYGPYVQAWAIRDTRDHLLRVFPIRSCTQGVFRAAKASGRPCLLADIDRCCAPCISRISVEEHGELVNKLLRFLDGQQQSVLDQLQTDMSSAVADLDYERAAVLRDDIAALERVAERSRVVLSDHANADFIAVSADELQAAVEVFVVRDGRIVGQRAFMMECGANSTDASLVTDALMHYADRGDLPAEILVNSQPDETESLIELISERRGARVSIAVPQRGPKRSLMQTVAENAGQELARFRGSRTTDLAARSNALAEIQQALDLSEAPLRIECIDISHTQGAQAVGSLVVFEDGLPRKSGYRSYNIVDARDDTAAVAQVVSRRFRTEEVRAYSPSLVIIDGGPAQVAAATAALAQTYAADVAVAGLAKRLEEIWLPGRSDPVIMPRNSEGLFLLQRIRDEAHRFAITRHRGRRGKAVRASALDDIAGIGPTKKKALLKRFDSVKRIKAATPEEIATIPGIGLIQAQQILAELQRDDNG